MNASLSRRRFLTLAGATGVAAALRVRPSRAAAALPAPGASGTNHDFALGYYTRDDLPLTSTLVDNFTTFDRWFCSILGPTYPNRFYTHAAATDRIDNSGDTSSLPTIWDRLTDAGVPATYYYS